MTEKRVTISGGSRGFGKSQLMRDMVLDTVRAGEEVFVYTATPESFEEGLQARAAERGHLVWTTLDKGGVRVSGKPKL